MPTFNPQGFQYSRSLTASQPFANGVQKYFWNPLFNGYAGDAVCNMLYYNTPTPTAPFEPAPVALGGYVYPVPLNYTPTGFTPADGQTVVYPTQILTIGVISSFKYYPASLSNGQYIVSQTFPAGTQLQPGTLAEVYVVSDPAAVYSIQIQQTLGLTPALTANLFWALGADQAYGVIVPNATNTATNYFIFPQGVLEGNGPAAGSRAYLYGAGKSVNSAVGTGDSTNGPSPFIAITIGLTEGIDGNGFSGYLPSTPATPIAPLIPNPYADVALNKNFMYSNELTAYSHPGN